MAKYLTRRKVPAYLREKFGIRATYNTLSSQASEGRGPPYDFINGACLYQPEKIDAWVAQEASKGPLRQRRRAAKALQAPAAGEA